MFGPKNKTKPWKTRALKSTGNDPLLHEGRSYSLAFDWLVVKVCISLSIYTQHFGHVQYFLESVLGDASHSLPVKLSMMLNLQVYEPTTKPLLTQAYTISYAKIAANITSAKPTPSRKKNVRAQMINQTYDALFFHTLGLKQTFNFSQKTNQTHTFQSCRLFESVVIPPPKKKHIRQRPGFYQIWPCLVNIILHENNIKIENG